MKTTNEVLEDLISKYQKQWDKNGMGSGISYSRLISDLEEIKSLNQRERQPVTDNKGNGSGCINLLHHEDIEEYGSCYYCKETKS